MVKHLKELYYLLPKCITLMLMIKYRTMYMEIVKMDILIGGQVTVEREELIWAIGEHLVAANLALEFLILMIIILYGLVAMMVV